MMTLGKAKKYVSESSRTVDRSHIQNIADGTQFSISVGADAMGIVTSRFTILPALPPPLC
jgi:hypothetical protein